MEKKTFLDELFISKNRLDKAAETQAELAWRYGDEFAAAKVKKDRLEDQLDLIMAEETMAVRERAKKNGEKLTLDDVQAAVIQTSRVRSLKAEILAAIEAVYTLNAAVTALEHRNSQIKVLKDLYCSQYFTVDDRPTREAGVSTDVRRKLNQKKGVPNE